MRCSTRVADVSASGAVAAICIGAGTVADAAAALGVDFYAAKGALAFPERYKNALFIAEHGSWNRKEKVGYRVSVMFETDKGPQYAPFITGWLQGQANWGRPSDVLTTPEGDLLISDDQTGSIYRVSYTGGGSKPGALGAE